MNAARRFVRPPRPWLLKPTGAGGVTVVLAVVLGLIGARATNPWLLLLACALLAPVLVSQVLRPDLGSISVRLHSPDRVVVGDSSEQVFDVHNNGRRSSPALLLRHSVTGFATITLAVPALPPAGRAELTVVRQAVSRGVSLVHDVRLWTAAPFGMALHQRSLRVSAKISVHPARGPVAVVPAGALGSTGGGRPNRLGDEPHELREWRRGDTLRQVHWRATARRDRLTVVVPENTVRSRVALVIIGVPGDDHEPLLGTAAWTAVQVVRTDGILRLSAVGHPDYVGDDPGTVLDWFAALGPLQAGSTVLLKAAQIWAGSTGSLVLAGTRPGEAAQLAPRAFVLAPDGRIRAT